MTLTMRKMTCLLLLLLGCKPHDEPARRPAMRVHVTPVRLVLHAGEGAQLSAEIDDENDQPIGGAPLRYEVADARLASVTPTGWVRATGGVGKTTVTASSNGISTEAAVVVAAGPPAALRVVHGDAQSIAAGQPLPIAIELRVSDVNDNPLPHVTVTLATEGGALDPQRRHG